MENNNTSFLTYKCELHSLPRIGDSISACQWIFNIDSNNTRPTYSHVISLKKPIKNTTNSSTIKTNLNESKTYDCIYEYVENPCLTTIAQLGGKTSKELLLIVTNRMVEYFFILHQRQTINKLLNGEGYARVFCENVANISTNNDVTFLFRYALESTKSHTKLKIQSYKLVDIITYIFLGTPSKKKFQSEQCTIGCRLKKYQHRFLNFDYSIFHEVCKYKSKKKAELNELMFEEFIKKFHHNNDNVSQYITLMKM